MSYLVTAFVTIFALIAHVSPKKPMLGYNIAEMPPPNKYESPGTMRFPETFFHNKQYRQPTSFKDIQYAPLHTSLTQQKNKNETTTRISSSINVNITPQQPRSFKKEYLEPRVKQTKEGKNKHDKSCYKVELDPEVVTTVSRSPGYNAVYRSFQQILPRDKSFKNNRQSKKRNEPMGPPKKALRKLNYIRPYGIYRALEVRDTTNKWPSDIASEIKKEMVFSNQNLVFNEDEIKNNFNSIFTISKRQLIDPSNKYFTNRLHLNIARVYNTGKQQKTLPLSDAQILTYEKPIKGRPFQPKTIRLTLYKAV